MENLERKNGSASEGFKELIRSMLEEEEQGIRTTGHFKGSQNYDRLNVGDLSAEDEEMYGRIMSGQATESEFNEYRFRSAHNAFTAYLGNLFMEKIVAKELE